MQRVLWTKGNIYGTIANSYVDFIVRNYGTATVVFGGYQEMPSTKYNTNDRCQQIHHPLVSVSPDTVFNGKNVEFLSRGSNKQALIKIVGVRLRDKL